MKIAWIIPGPLAQTTGGYIYDTCIIHHIRAHGHDVHLVSLPMERLEWPLAQRRHGLDGLLEELRTFAWVVGDELAHAELGWLFEHLPASCRTYLLVHHLASWDAAGSTNEERASERGAVLAAHHVITTSMHSAQRIEREFSVAAQAIVPGSDRLAFAPRLPCDLASPSLIAIGAVTPRKRIVELIQAFALHRHGTLRIIGDCGRDSGYVVQVRAAIDLACTRGASIELANVVSDDALVDIYARASLLVHTARYEGYGMALAEARRAGVPLLVTPSGATLEATGAGNHVYSTRIENLGEALRHCTSSATLRSMQRAAASTAPGPSWQEAGRAFEAHLFATA